MLIVSFVSQVAVVGSVEMPKADPWVIFAVLSTVIGYIAKTYFTLSISFWFLLYGLDFGCIYYSFCRYACYT